MIVAAKQEETQESKPEPRRSVLCDVFAGGCGKGFSVSVREYSAAEDVLCEDCKAKHARLNLLRTQLRRVEEHTDQDCQRCAIQNEIDLLTGHDWRAERDARIDKTMQPLPRGGSRG